MRLLLVEDEPSAARLIEKGLREHGYIVDVARNGLTASHQLATTPYDAVVLDVMLPGKDGLAICRELRETGSAVPVLMLTARDSIDARIVGLEAGADDYLTKPFDFRELVARVRALIRRRTPTLAPRRLELGPLVIDTDAREVFMNGRAVTLTAREYALLEYLGRRPGVVVSRSEIAASVWDDPWNPMSNVIDVYVQRLRRKLDADGSSFIRTRRGAGYQLVVPDAQPA
jgi:two-component system copper resistance phosphate regulon response regulator CusR